MQPIYNKYLPIKGYKAINLFGIIFARSESKPLSQIDINHEKIHSRQMQEMLFVFFYLWYVVEWLVRLIQYQNTTDAYYNISFEREAHKNQSNPDYLKTRHIWEFRKYLRQ